MQAHPLYAQDRALVDQLLAAPTPADEHLAHAARLLLRYQGFPGAFDVQRDLQTCLARWGLERDSLHARTRALWASGWRPPLPTEEPAVGSGADVSADA